MLTCNEVNGKLSDYMAGRLEKPESDHLRLHLKTCKSCPRVTRICGVWVLQEKTARTPIRPKPALASRLR